jgi:hypothetical protein
MDVQRNSPLESRNIGNDAFHTGHGPQQRFQARLGPQRNPVSELGEMGAEAGEQKIVAKTLFSSDSKHCRSGSIVRCSATQVSLDQESGAAAEAHAIDLQIF